MNHDKQFKLLTLGFVKELAKEIKVDIRMAHSGWKYKLSSSKPIAGLLTKTTRYAPDLETAIRVAREMNPCRR